MWESLAVLMTRLTGVSRDITMGSRMRICAMLELLTMGRYDRSETFEWQLLAP